MKSVRRGIERRTILKGATALGAASLFPMPAIASTRKVEYTLAWLPTGQYAFMSVARQLFLKERGIDLEVKRGYGSLAATQALASGQFQIGSASTAGALLGVLKGLDYKFVATHGYDSSMGVLVPTEGPIKTPKDLTGKKIGVTAAGGDTPFLSSYLELVGVDPNAVTSVALDSQLIEQSVMTGQVDCMLAFGMSSIPNFLIQNFPVTLFPFSEVGLTFYWINTLVHPSLAADEPQLIADIVDGLMEGQKFTMLNPAEAIERHLKQYPEIEATTNGSLFTELGVGMVSAAMISKENRQHGLGYTDLDSLAKQAKLVKDFLATPEDKDPPGTANYCTNEFVGKVQLTEEEWRIAEEGSRKYAQMLGFKV